MRVTTGTRLGPYEIVEQIGAGGMGEVWKARDTRLERNVAVKILPAEFAANAMLRSRFEREAKTISQLSHPNICTLYDVGEAGAASEVPSEERTSYLVMELLDGETLADRLARGPLPMPEVLRVGREIAEALDRAHRAGVVHRDLKPGNIMLTKSGSKLLDFGLAKAGLPTSAPYDATQHRPLTEEGTILGTFQYMAPEQLEGLEADPRTDIFALGAVLYEMATGKRAFQGASKTSLIAAIVAAEPPPISSIQSLTPAAFEHVVRKCLAKDREARWQSAYDIAEELRWIGETPSGAGVAAPARKARTVLQWTGWLVAAAIAMAAVIDQRANRASVPERMETAIAAPDNVAISYVAGSIALSADGKQIAFVGRAANGKPSLWVRSLAHATPRQLAGTEDARFPFWSPDAKYLAFVSDRKLRRLGIEGGAPETIADVAGFLGGVWSPGGDILFSDTQTIKKVSASGGTPVPIFTEGGRNVSAPALLPDGRHILFTTYRGNRIAEGVSVASIDGKEQKMVLPAVYSNAQYASGFIIFSREGDLRALRFDPGKMATSGDPIRLADHVQYDPDSKSALFSASQNGMLLFVEGEGAGKSELTWVTRDGKDAGVIAPPAMFYSPDLSHDGKKVAFDLSDGETAKGDIWTYDLSRQVMSRVSYDPANESMPIWTADDRALVFFSEKGGSLDLYRRPAFSTGADEILLADPSIKIPADLSPDGRWLLFERVDRAHPDNTDIWMYDMSKKTAAPFIATPFREAGAQFSPDGRAIAYTSDDSGKREVYVQQFPESAGRVMVSRGGGMMAAWRGDGKELYYISDDSKLMAVPMTLAPQLDSGPPVPLFEARVRHYGSPKRQYAVAADGSKFLLNRMVGEEGTRPLTLVQNWTALQK